MKGAIVFCRAIVPCFLFEPFAECLFGLGHGKCVGVHYDGGVILIGHLIDKEIVVSAREVIDGGEAFVF